MDIPGVPEADGEGRVHREALSSAAPHFIDAAGAGVIGILVRRKEEHGGIVIKGPLRAVAVVQVPVDDQYPLEPVPPLCEPCVETRFYMD